MVVLVITLSGNSLVEENGSILILYEDRWGKDRVSIELNHDTMTAHFYETGEKLMLNCKKLR